MTNASMPYDILLLSDSNSYFVDDILYLEKACFPPDWQYEDPRLYYINMIYSEVNINLIILYNQKAIGYLLAIPHNDALLEMSDIDTSIDKDGNRYYLDTIQVLDKYRGNGFGMLLLERLFQEAEERGVKRFSTHARTNNGFNFMIRKLPGCTITCDRLIDRWAFGGNEPYEYLEWIMS